MPKYVLHTFIGTNISTCLRLVTNFSGMQFAYKFLNAFLRSINKVPPNNNDKNYSWIVGGFRSTKYNDLYLYFIFLTICCVPSHNKKYLSICYTNHIPSTRTYYTYVFNNAYFIKLFLWWFCVKNRGILLVGGASRSYMAPSLIYNLQYF